MAQKFKVGQMVEDFEKGVGTVTQVDNNEEYPVSVEFESRLSDEYTVKGQRWQGLKPVLRLTGRPFNIGDRVVIGGEKGVVSGIGHDAHATRIMVHVGEEPIWITADGRAWPETPIICEHDWEEESETVSEKVEKGINALGEAAASCGFESMPVNNSIEYVTVIQEEINHIAEMQEQAIQNRAEIDNLKEQHNYARMALVLAGIGIELRASALVTEVIKKVLELGDEFSIKTACEIEARVNQMYDEPKI